MTKSASTDASSSANPADVSPEAGIERDPDTGQAKKDRSLRSGDPRDLPDGGAKAAPDKPPDR